MAVPSTTTFYVGLFLIVIGTGLLKGNVSVIVGALYGKDDIRRDAGFSIFYMGINLGAFVAPLICGYLGQKITWHAGFAAAGFGMLIGVVQYVLGGRYLGEAGKFPAPAESVEAGALLRRRVDRLGRSSWWLRSPRSPSRPTPARSGSRRGRSPTGPGTAC